MGWGGVRVWGWGVWVGVVCGWGFRYAWRAAQTSFRGISSYSNVCWTVCADWRRQSSASLVLFYGDRWIPLTKSQLYWNLSYASSMYLDSPAVSIYRNTYPVAAVAPIKARSVWKYRISLMIAKGQRWPWSQISKVLLCWVTPSYLFIITTVLTKKHPIPRPWGRSVECPLLVRSLNYILHV